MISMKNKNAVDAKIEKNKKEIEKIDVKSIIRTLIVAIQEL